MCLDECRAFHLARESAIAQREATDPIALLSPLTTSDDLRVLRGRDDGSQVARKDSSKSSRWPSCRRHHHLHRFPPARIGRRNLPVPAPPIVTSKGASSGGTSQCLPKYPGPHPEDPPLAVARP